MGAEMEAVALVSVVEMVEVVAWVAEEGMGEEAEVEAAADGISGGVIGLAGRGAWIFDSNLPICL